MLLKQRHFKWLHNTPIPWLKPKHWWEEYEQILVIAASVVLVTILGFLLRFSIVPKAVTEQLYISPLSYSYEADFFVTQDSQPTLNHPLEIVQFFDDSNPFTTLPAHASSSPLTRRN